MCGHSQGYHWQTNLLASCAKVGCKCMTFREVKEPEPKPRSETAIVLDQILKEDKERNNADVTQGLSETERRIRRIAAGTGQTPADNRKDAAISGIADSGPAASASGRDESKGVHASRDGRRNGRSGLRSGKA